MKIKNIVFDVGNVLVRWDPIFITRQIFPDCNNYEKLKNDLFASNPWFDLNLGRITEQEAIVKYNKLLGIDVNILQSLMQATKESLSPIDGSIEILELLNRKGFDLYALTNNTNEIISYLKSRYSFFKIFKGIVSSSEVGITKPSLDIYHHLLKVHELSARETLFIDDHLPNLNAADVVGIKTLQFKDSKKCFTDLKDLKILI